MSSAELYHQVKQADIEDALCLATLIAVDAIGNDDQDHMFYGRSLDTAAIWRKIETSDDCGNCKYRDKCLACMINE